MLGIFMRLSALDNRFKFDVIRLTDYGVIAQKAHVTHLPDFFRAPCKKNYASDGKMFDTF